MSAVESMRRMKAAGFTREQADEAVIDAYAGETATRADLTAGLAERKADMLKVAIGIVLGTVTLNAALTWAIVRAVAS